MFTDDEMLSAVGHLANHGYVTRLRRPRRGAILLAPELLNNLAASFVLEARRNPKGLGSLEEQRLLTGELPLPRARRPVRGRSARSCSTRRSCCSSSTTSASARPTRSRRASYLVFPELINLKQARARRRAAGEDGVAYTVSGAVENVYASLVVLLGYTQTFTRTNQWRDHARYVVGGDMVCGFRLEAERDGELDFVLYFGETVGAPFRTLFQSLFESFLARRNLTVRRFEPVVCANGHQINRAVVREQVREGQDDDVLRRLRRAGVAADRRHPDRVDRAGGAGAARASAARSRSAHASSRCSSGSARYVAQEELAAPSASSATRGATPRRSAGSRSSPRISSKAGLGVILDRWDNARVGASVPRFLERIATATASS